MSPEHEERVVRAFERIAAALEAIGGARLAPTPTERFTAALAKVKSAAGAADLWRKAEGALGEDKQRAWVALRRRLEVVLKLSQMQASEMLDKALREPPAKAAKGGAR